MTQPPDIAPRDPAVLACLTTMKKRRDFLAAARARRAHVTGFVLQARDRRDQDDTVRVGFTCSKKVGNAVARNRAKRRLREIARLTLPPHAQPGWDYVLIGRANVTATLDFTQLCADLETALAKIHQPRPQ